MKLMFVGVQGIGKTSLLNQLRREGRSITNKPNKVVTSVFITRKCFNVSYCMCNTILVIYRLNCAYVVMGFGVQMSGGGEAPMLICVN